MAFPWLAAIAGASVANQIFGGRGAARRARRDRAAAVAKLEGSRPQGYLTDEDLRAGELTRGRLRSGNARTAQQGRYDAVNRFRASGLPGSAAEERALGRISAYEALANEQAGESAEGQLYDTRLSRENFERQKALAIFGVNTQTASNDERRADLQNSTFWNSILEGMPAITGYFGGGVPPTGISPSPGINLTPSADPALDIPDF